MDRPEDVAVRGGLAQDRPEEEAPGCAAAVAAQVARERRRADAANARAERERERARRATERALAAEARLAELEASASWRLTRPARRLAYAVPKPLYDLVRKAPGHLLRGHTPRGGGPEQRPPAPAAPAAAIRVAEPARRRGPAALLIDDHWPRPDRDSGSIDIANLAGALVGLGFEVLFGADRDHAAGPGGGEGGGSPGRDALAARGVRCLGPADAPSVGAFLEREGGRFALVVLNRVYGGGRFMEEVRRHCTGARAVFNTIDVHHLRVRREAELRGDAAGLAAARAVREREEALVREADATLVVSDAERDLLAASVPGANIVVLPLAREVRPPAAPFGARSGIGFIGGFAHAPNIDALRFFLAEVWPLVLRGGDPGFGFSIVGADLPPDTLDGAPSGVRYLGPVPDAAPWFESLRLTVAPLRFGAGVKGKVASSLAAGVPCVATPIAVEGMGLRDGDGVLVAATPEQMADRVLRAHADPGLWAELSSRGLAHAADAYSPAAWRRTLAEALWVLDALPAGAAAAAGTPGAAG